MLWSLVLQLTKWSSKQSNILYGIFYDSLLDISEMSSTTTYNQSVCIARGSLTSHFILHGHAPEVSLPSTPTGSESGLVLLEHYL